VYFLFRTKLIPTLVLGLLFWVPAQILNFLYLPPHMRVVYIALCTFVEVNILCLLKRMDFTTADKEQPASKPESSETS
jgi:Mpv17-like protein